MASIQEVVDTTHRIRENARGLGQRTTSSAGDLQRRGMALAALVRGSRTGENAVRQVQQAERDLRAASASLLALQRDIDTFTRELTK